MSTRKTSGVPRLYKKPIEDKKPKPMVVDASCGAQSPEKNLYQNNVSHAAAE